jgi:hypothetical protein
MTFKAKTFYRLAAVITLAVVPRVAATAADVNASLQKAAAETAAQRGDAFWRQIATAQPRPTSGCRQLLGYALALCEARVHPERLERLFALTLQMQDQDPKSKNWGNLRWYWRDAGVTDANAVEFCMQDALQRAWSSAAGRRRTRWFIAAQRQWGTLIDRLMLTADPKDWP